jgi:hypothetical protein
LVSGRANPGSVVDLATTIERVGFGVELHKGQPGKPVVLDVVVDDV